jgi:hypothetical protein
MKTVKYLAILLIVAYLGVGAYLALTWGMNNSTGTASSDIVTFISILFLWPILLFRPVT